MVKKIISVAISEESLDRVDARSKAMGLSRSEFLEQMIKNGWSFSPELENVVDTIIGLQEKLSDKLEVDEK